MGIIPVLPPIMRIQQKKMCMKCLACCLTLRNPLVNTYRQHLYNLRLEIILAQMADFWLQSIQPPANNQREFHSIGVGWYNIRANYRTRIKLRDSISPKTHRTQRPSVRGTEQARDTCDTHACARCAVTAPRCPGLPGTSPAGPRGERNHPDSMNMNEAQSKPLRALQGLIF